MFLLLFFLPTLSTASVSVAFLEIYGADGKRIELEIGSRFAHVAISYHGQWLQAYPGRGVELVSFNSLQKLGEVTAIVNLVDASEPSIDFVESILGTPYESTFSWMSNRYYCSKLVGKILNLSPDPMNFNAPYWPIYYKKYNGLPGLSPDGVFRKLQKNAHGEVD